MAKKGDETKYNVRIRDKRTKEQLLWALEAARRDADYNYDLFQKLNVRLEEVRQDLNAKRANNADLEQDRGVLRSALEHMVASALAVMGPLTFWRTLRTNAKLLDMELTGPAAHRIENACRDVAAHVVTASCRLDEKLERTFSDLDKQ